MLRSPLMGTLRELERLYRDAEQALVAKPSQGQQTAEAGSSAAARAALFDDDLDLRVPPNGLSGRCLPISSLSDVPPPHASNVSGDATLF